MKRFAILPLAALAFAAACSDSSKGLLEPTMPEIGGPSFDNVGSTGGSLNATTNTMNLTAGGTAGTTTLFVDPTGGDGKSGCNLTGKTELVVDVVSSSTAVTVSPTRITFGACGDVPTLTITPVATGSANITLSQVSNNTGGTFDLRDAAFAVSVVAATPSDVTAPVITPSIVGTPGNNGWYTSNVSVTWSVTDGESAVSNETNCGPAIIITDTDGQTITCSATSAGGTATQSVTIKRDATAPLIDPIDLINTDWRNTDLSQAFTASDAGSGLANAADASFTLTASDESVTASTPTTASKTVKDNAGNSTTRTLSALIDLTAPSVVYTSVSSGTAGSNGWYTSDVTATFTGTDALSGFGTPATSTTTRTSTTSGEGLSVSVSSPAFTDNAGNTQGAGTATSAEYKIDKTNPTDVTFVFGGSYYFGSVPAAQTCEAVDLVSGIASCIVTGYSTLVGTHILTATATDNAGRTSAVTRSYTVLAWTTEGYFQPVNMTAGFVNTVKGGSTVPLKFEVFKGTEELTSTSAIKEFKQVRYTCESGATEDTVDILTTGGTSLRYDGTAGQFIQNWQTPKQAGACYRATVTMQDGSFISANFKLK